MSRIAGVVHIKVDGTSYTTSVEEGFTIRQLGTKAEYVKDNFGRNHFTEMPVIDELEGSFLMVDGLNPTIVTNLRNAVIKIEFGNAKTYVLRDAGYSGDGEVSTKDGSFKVKFSGTGRWY